MNIYVDRDSIGLVIVQNPREVNKFIKLEEEKSSQNYKRIINDYKLKRLNERSKVNNPGIEGKIIEDFYYNKCFSITNFNYGKQCSISKDNYQIIYRNWRKKRV